MLMMSTGLPELQSYEDIEYLRNTLQCNKADKEARDYFLLQLKSAIDGSAYTKIDWFFHNVRR